MRIFGNLMNRIQEHTTGIPTVGMPCTICMYTDRHAATVVKVCTPSKIIIQEDKATRIDTNGMSDCGQKYTYERDTSAPMIVYTKRKNGTWRESKGTNGLRLGYRDKFHDFGF